MHIHKDIDEEKIKEAMMSFVGKIKVSSSMFSSQPWAHWIISPGITRDSQVKMLKLYGFAIELRHSSKFRVELQPEMNNPVISRLTMRISFVFKLFLVSPGFRN